MKKKLLIRFLCFSLCSSVLFSACGVKPDPGPRDVTEDEQSGTGTDTASGEKTKIEYEPEPLSYPFKEVVADTDRMIAEAVEQYNSEDYTPLDEAVKYNVLWLGFTHVTYNELDFQMTDFDKEYLEAVALNFEKSVEKITDNNLDITVDLHFVDDTTALTQYPGAEWLYLDQGTVQQYIDRYITPDTDTVLTTVETAGEENVSRNESKEGYGVNYVMLGLETSNLSAPIGYSTFDLGEPKDGTYPLADPEVPSLYATAVAVHEWMHQLEALKTFLNIEYPDTHAYQGQTPGYAGFTADANDYDYFEFYKLVLTGKLEYTDGGTVKHVGMYPKMWPLAKRSIHNLGKFTIAASDGNGYLTGQENDPTLTLSDNVCEWNIRYWGNGHLALTPTALPDKLIDLSNAWDNEGNSIGLWVYTGYTDAQSWYLTENSDGSYSIKTPYESGRLLTAQKGQGATLCTEGAEGTQKWFFKQAK